MALCVFKKPSRLSSACDFLGAWIPGSLCSSVTGLLARTRQISGSGAVNTSCEAARRMGKSRFETPRGFAAKTLLSRE